MADSEMNSNPSAILVRASADILTARKAVQALYEQLATTNENAKQIARNELCRGLLERLQLAEREASELAELITMAKS
jgi:hypothetical protein